MRQEADNCEDSPGASVVKNPPANAGDTGDLGSVLGSERYPEAGNGNPLHSGKFYGQRSRVHSGP